MSKKLFSIHAHACICVCVEKVIDIWERRTGKRTELAESQVTCFTIATWFINKSYMELFLKINLISSDGIFVLCSCFDSLLCFFYFGGSIFIFLISLSKGLGILSSVYNFH